MVFTSITLGLGSAGETHKRKWDRAKRSIEQRFEELDQEIKILKRKRELELEAADTAKKATAGREVWQFRVFVGVCRWEQQVILFRGINTTRPSALCLKGRTTSATAPINAPVTSMPTDFMTPVILGICRRVRPTIEGTLFGKYDFRFTPDFAGGTATVVDAYIDARFDPTFKVRIG